MACSGSLSHCLRSSMKVAQNCLPFFCHHHQRQIRVCPQASAPARTYVLIWNSSLGCRSEIRLDGAKVGTEVQCVPQNEKQSTHATHSYGRTSFITRACVVREKNSLGRSTPTFIQMGLWHQFTSLGQSTVVQLLFKLGKTIARS